MSEPDDFLSRWSRRKAAATEKDVAQAATPEVEADTNAEQKESSAATAAVPTVTPLPEFDPATLPSIESIEAGTDISAFLRAGVPADLTRAALRRAWAADPAIRDYIGLSENSWDFTANDGVPGFGPLSAEDAGRAMAQFTGKVKEVIERIGAIEPSAEPVETKQPPAESAPQAVRRDNEMKNTASLKQEKPEQDPPASADALNTLQCDKENIAEQQTKPESSESSQPTRRAHGSALPD